MCRYVCVGDLAAYAHTYVHTYAYVWDLAAYAHTYVHTYACIQAPHLLRLSDLPAASLLRLPLRPWPRIPRQTRC